VVQQLIEVRSHEHGAYDRACGEASPSDPFIVGFRLTPRQQEERGATKDRAVGVSAAPTPVAIVSSAALPRDGLA